MVKLAVGTLKRGRIDDDEDHSPPPKKTSGGIERLPGQSTTTEASDSIVEGASSSSHPPISDLEFPRSVPTKSASAHALLASLVEFIRPLIKPCITSSRGADHDELSVRDSTDGHEAENLIVALDRFIEAAVIGRPAISQVAHLAEKQSDRDQENRPDDADRPPPRDEDMEITPRPVVHISTSIQVVPQVVIDEVYRLVFNDMPIRILSFNENGTQQQLLERNAIADLILSRIRVAYSSGAVVDYGYDSDDESGGNDAGFDLVRVHSKYAILSHMWIRGIPGDVVFGDWHSRSLSENSLGYSKISGFCEVAAHNHGVLFGWMDTVCIDKNSSRELDESIRSMYRWYRLAHVCVTYLSETTGIEDMHQDSWFTRGWTLQELLAPRDIQFYNKHWELLLPDAINPKVEDPEFSTELSTELMLSLERSGLGQITFESDTMDMEIEQEIPIQLQYQIFKATTITRDELLVFRMNSELVPISRKMQLAVNRRVTREEDKIYSLMGLLGVGMPVAYGEGLQTAFTRLMREIMASKDHLFDIFNHSHESRLFPSSITDYMERPSLFDRTDRGLDSSLHYSNPIEPIILTHLGVRIPLLLIPAFRKLTYESRVPSGSVTHTVYGNSNLTSYLLLKNDDVANNWVNDLSVTKEYGKWEPRDVVFFGILTFSSDNPFIWMPATCLSIPIDPGHSTGTFRRAVEINPANAKPASGPVVLQLDAELTNRQTKRAGMQILTLHLK